MRREGIAAGIALALLAPEAAAEGVIALGERDPAVMIVQTPVGAAPVARTAELLGAASAVLAAHTDLVLQSIEQAGSDPTQLAQCTDRDRLSCWVRGVRPDYDRMALERGEGEVAPYAEHAAWLERRGARAAAYLIVLSVFPREGTQDRLTATLLDTDEVLRLYHEAPRTPGWVERVEDRVFAEAVRTAPAVVDTAVPAELAHYFEGVIGGAFRPAFERAGRWGGLGAIALRAPAGLSVEVDGRVVGLSAGGGTRLEELRPGRRRLRLVDPRAALEPVEVTVAVRAGETTALEVAPPARAQTLVLRRVLMWSGVGLAAAGVALAAYGAAASPSFDEYRLCAGGQCPGARRFLSFCELAAEAPSDCDPAARGVLAAPLGYSLALAGGGLALGAGVIGDEDAVPWVGIAAGALLGGLAYGLSAALDGGSP